LRWERLVAAAAGRVRWLWEARKQAHISLLETF